MTLPPGALLPRLELTDAGGAPAAPPADGRPALLLVYKGDCAASEVAAAVLPRFTGLAGLEVVAISQDGPEATRAFAATHGWAAIAVRRDPPPWRASDALGVRATPTWLLLDAGGRVAASSEGWSREEVNALARHAALLLGAEPPTVAADGGPEPAFRPG